MRQAIRILQLSTDELNEYLEDQCLSNPMLDMPDIVEKQSVESAARLEGIKGVSDADSKTPQRSQTIEWKEYFNANDYSNHDHFYYSDDDATYDGIERIPYEDASLADHLMLQLNTCKIDAVGHSIAMIVIEAIDESGYLASTAGEIAEEAGVSEEKVNKVLEIIHKFDPPGIGAANLKECLLIQIDQIDQMEQLSQGKQAGIDLDLPRSIVESHLEDLAVNRMASITRAQQVSTQEAQKACDFIKTLEPKPGRNFIRDGQTRYIIPDIIIEKDNGGFSVNIVAKAAPRLRINRYYKKYLSNQEKDAEIVKYLNEKLNSAMWLIKSVEQRRNTIRKLVESILLHQKEFFENGKAYLKYLTLKQVADEMGVHISTVSRAARGKYLQCRFGVFELKYFFDSGISEKDEGGASSKSAQEMIQSLIRSEDVKNPYSDRKLVEMMSERGVELSRRTVAKYRWMHNIQSSAKRKRY
jgi:RNA polymerase sigma-54 factor